MKLKLYMCHKMSERVEETQTVRVSQNDYKLMKLKRNICHKIAERVDKSSNSTCVTRWPSELMKPVSQDD